MTREETLYQNINKLLMGESPNGDARLDYGEYNDMYQTVSKAFAEGGTEAAREALGAILHTNPSLLKRFPDWIKYAATTVKQATDGQSAGSAGPTAGSILPPSCRISKPQTVQLPGVPGVPGESLNINAFPKPVADMINAIATATETDPLLSATKALGALSVAVTPATISLHSEWVEPVVLYLMVVAASGEGKTMAFNYLMKPIIEYQKELRQTWVARVKEARKKRQNEDDQEEKEEAEEEPIIFVGNITTERLGSLMMNCGEHMAILSDEGRGIASVLLGRYSKKGVGDGELDLYLSAWNGTYYRLERATREPVVLENPQLNICIGMQPDAFQRCGESDSLREGGLLARFLIAQPESNVGKRTFNTPPVPSQVVQAYNEYMRSILAQRKGRVCTLSPSGYEMVQEYRRMQEPMLAEGGKYEHIRDWVNKSASHIARLATILYLANSYTSPGTEVIPDAYVQEGIDLTYCFQSLWNEAIQRSSPAGILTRDAQRVLKWLSTTQDIGAVVSLRQVYASISVLKSQEARNALALLSELGIVEELQTEGRRDSKMYRFYGDTPGTPGTPGT